MAFDQQQPVYARQNDNSAPELRNTSPAEKLTSGDEELIRSSNMRNRPLNAA